MEGRKDVELKMFSLSRKIFHIKNLHMNTEQSVVLLLLGNDFWLKTWFKSQGGNQNLNKQQSYTWTALVHDNSYASLFIVKVINI